jgi:SAM-dependent methyltransferase/GT2 family glycosyltransferase
VASEAANPFTRHDRDVEAARDSTDPDEVKRLYRRFGDYLHETFEGADAPVLSYAETAPIVAAALPAGLSPVLDAGCGPNPAAGLAVARRGSRVVALDIGIGTVKLALATAARGGVDLLPVVGDVERLPFRTGAFAGLICDDTIEHVPDDRSAVRDLGRVLRAGGIAVVATPNRRGLHVLRRRAVDLRHRRVHPARHYYAAASHLREYTPSSLVRLLGGSFDAVTLTSVGFHGGDRWERIGSAVVRLGALRRLSKVVVATARRPTAVETAALRIVRSPAAARGDRSASIAVAVSCRNRAALVPRLVAALEAQDLGAERFEVVLVDDASDDATFDAMEEAAETTTLALTAARLPARGGPARGRNAAWRLSSAPVIAFTDDDCQPDPGWLRAGLEAQRAHVVGSGCTIPDPAQATHAGPFSRTMAVSDVGLVATCNAFYRRSDLDAVDGFDESYTTPGGEDTDLAWRVADRGVPLTYVPGAVVRHDVSRSDVRAALRTAWRWHHIPHVLADHPGRGRAAVWRHWFWRRSHAPAVAALVALVLALRWRPAIVGVLPWIRHRLVVEPLASPWSDRVSSLPGAFAVDAVEVAACVRGSVRHRTLLL